MPTFTDNQRDMAEALPSMIWTATPSGQVDYVNHVFAHYTGHPANQDDTIDWLAVVHPDDHESTLRIWGNCIASGAKYQAEFRIFHKPSNSYRWHHVAATPHHNADGTIRRWYGITTDIHDIKLANRAVDKAHDELKRVVALQALESKVLDAISQERELQDMLDIVTHAVDDFIPEVRSSILLVKNGCLWHGSAPKHPQDYIEAINGISVGEGNGSCGTSAARQEPVIVTDINTDPLWASVNDLVELIDAKACWSIPVIGATGKVLATFGIYSHHPAPPTDEQLATINHICQFVRVAIERTQQREAARQIERQLQLSQSREAIVKLTGGLAHDFNNLLTVILSNAGQLAEELTEGSEHQEMALDIKRAARRGADMIRNLLSFSRQQLLQPKPVHVNSLLTDMHTLAERVLDSRITLNLALEARPATIMVDPAQLENAVLNLLLNARDAIQNSGTVTLRTRTVNHYNAALPRTLPVNATYLLLEVQDDGHGIAPDAREHIFDPFYTTKDVGNGSGLGLSMVDGFVKQSKGGVAVTSALGQGTTISLYFPVMADVVTASGAKSEIETPPSGTGKILVVEDEPAVQATLVRQLQKLGYQVLAAGNGHEGLLELQRHPDIDLLLTDMMMPGGMDGQQLATLARRHNPNIRVVLSSGYSHKLAKDQDRTAEGYWLLPKPYLRIDLATLLKKALATLAT